MVEFDHILVTKPKKMAITDESKDDELIILSDEINTDEEIF